MSWKRTYNTFKELIDDTHADRGEDIATGHQINEARKQASALISSGVIGSPEGDADVPARDFVISMEGHANEEHFAQFSQDTKDYIRISITQK